MKGLQFPLWKVGWKVGLALLPQFVGHGMRYWGTGPEQLPHVLSLPLPQPCGLPDY